MRAVDNNIKIMLKSPLQKDTFVLRKAVCVAHGKAKKERGRNENYSMSCATELLTAF